jgi:hypothetical protein
LLYLKPTLHTSLQSSLPRSTMAVLARISVMRSAGPSLPRQWGHLKNLMSHLRQVANRCRRTQLRAAQHSLVSFGYLHGPIRFGHQFLNGSSSGGSEPDAANIGRSNGFFSGGGDTVVETRSVQILRYCASDTSYEQDNQRLFARHVSCALIASCKQVSGTEGCPGAGGGSLRA